MQGKLANSHCLSALPPALSAEHQEAVNQKTPSLLVNTVVPKLLKGIAERLTLTTTLRWSTAASIDVLKQLPAVDKGRIESVMSAS